ncbi:MAG: hypothetical protein OJJ21_16345 [Ferrovibrio sp.]|uniref:hypothetical protein n=1 Tax=Ferrovibrio sp. TaxID=1917215 RepID=UPI002604C625|nr:hypothetical protein [Ferrovibrio sp.]MCW0235172.1 hypothetical protein [Ferrovibrio sp.]
MPDHQHHRSAAQRPARQRLAFDLPIAVLTAGIGLRMAALLPLIAALWAAIWWALGAD